MADIVKYDGNKKNAKDLLVQYASNEHLIAKVVTEIHRLQVERKANVKKLRESPAAVRNFEISKQLNKLEIGLQRFIGARDAVGNILERMKALPPDTALTRTLKDPEKAKIMEEASR